MPARNPYPTAAPFLPGTLSMTALREAVQRCRGCPLYANATQAVFGEGTLKAEVMLVGEQPGDQEDLAGAPFVGPGPPGLAERCPCTRHEVSAKRAEIQPC